MSDFLIILRQSKILLCDIFRITRIYNVRVMIFFYMFGVVLGGFKIDFTSYFLVFVIFFLFYAHASYVNYLYDKNIDQANKRYNPFLHPDSISEKLPFIVFILPLIALCLCFFMERSAVILVGTAILFLLGWLYSAPPFRLSHNPILKTMFLWLSYALIPGLLGYFNSTQQYKHNLSLLFWLSILYGSWLLYSDIKDIKGDRKYGKYTFAVVLGVQKLTMLSLSIATIASLFILRASSEQNIVLRNIVFILISAQGVAALFPKLLLSQRVRHVGGYIVWGGMLLILISFLRT